MPDQRCRCGHARGVHEHLHDRGYCGRCGAQACDHYRPDPGFWAVAATRIRRHLALIRRRR